MTATRLRLASQITIATALISFPLAAQQGGEVTGDSPRMAGLAGAGLAGGSDLTEASHNPAMLGWVLSRERRGQIEFSLRGIDNPVIAESLAGGRFAGDDHLGLGPWFGVGARLGDNWAVALNLMPTAGGSLSFERETELNIAADEDPPGSGTLVPRTKNVEFANEMQQLAIDPSLAWRPTRAWSFGIGASIRSTEMDLSGAYDFALDDLAGAPPPVLGGLGNSWGEVLKNLGLLGGRELDDFQVDYSASAEADTSIFLRFGGAWRSERGTTVGFWYRPPSTATDLEGSVDIDVDSELGDIMRSDSVFGSDAQTDGSYDMRIRDIRFPQQFGVASMLPMGRRDRLHAQAIWTQWSRSFDGWTSELTNGTNADFNEMVGGNGDTSIGLDNTWSDAWSLSLGWEHDWEYAPAAWARRQRAARGRVTEGWQAVSRVGLGWSSNPVGGSVVGGLAPFNSWHLGAGLSLRAAPLGGVWHLGAVVALPDTLQAGENALLSDLSNDRYRQSNYALMLGWSLSW